MKTIVIPGYLKKAISSGEWTRRKPLKGEALPNRIDIMHSPVYVPEKIESVRVGGDDHKLFASLMTGSDSTYKRHHP